MITALPMYDLPEARAATDAWWAVLRRHLARAGFGEIPDALTRTPNVTDTWTMPGLLFTQTCGYPLTHGWSGHLRLIATPCYGAEGCEGPTYRSVILVAEGSAAASLAELRGLRAAYNADHSQSGFNALRAALAPLAKDGRFLGAAVRSGGHRQSMALVRSGTADFCAVDCVTWAMHQRHAPAEIAGLKVLAWSDAAPALPYVTAASQPDETVRRLRDGLAAAIADPDGTAARTALFLDGIEILDRAAYDRIDAMEAAAIAQGYPELA